MVDILRIKISEMKEIHLRKRARIHAASPETFVSQNTWYIVQSFSRKSPTCVLVWRIGIQIADYLVDLRLASVHLPVATDEKSPSHGCPSKNISTARIRNEWSLVIDFHYQAQSPEFWTFVPRSHPPMESSLTIVSLALRWRHPRWPIRSDSYILIASLGDFHKMVQYSFCNAGPARRKKKTNKTKLRKKCGRADGHRKWRQPRALCSGAHANSAFDALRFCFEIRMADLCKQTMILDRFADRCFWIIQNTKTVGLCLLQFSRPSHAWNGNWFPQRTVLIVLTKRQICSACYGVIVARVREQGVLQGAVLSRLPGGVHRPEEPSVPAQHLQDMLVWSDPKDPFASAGAALPNMSQRMSCSWPRCRWFSDQPVSCERVGKLAAQKDQSGDQESAERLSPKAWGAGRHVRGSRKRVWAWRWQNQTRNSWNCRELGRSFEEATGCVEQGSRRAGGGSQTEPSFGQSFSANEDRYSKRRGLVGAARWRQDSQRRRRNPEALERFGQCLLKVDAILFWRRCADSESTVCAQQRFHSAH